MLINPYRDSRSSKNEIPAISSRLVQQSLNTKQQIISELISGRLQLLEAAARFQVAHSATALCFANATGVPMGAADGESLCRTVIGWVHLSLSSNRPEEAERVSERLERELQGHLETGASMKLPPNQ